VLAEQVRSGLVETVHQGSVAIVEAGGALVASSGDINRPFFFRSSAKPFQAAVSQSCGADLVPEELAVACASHDGEPVHAALAEQILQRAGLTEDHLQCPPSWPLREAATHRLIRRGAAAPRRIWHNCSGKHAAMLAATVASGWDVASYRDPGHPLQRRIAAFVAEVAGPVTPLGIDGCGVPVFATTARQMALAFSRLATAPGLASIFRAMHSYPALVSGVSNTDAAIATHLHAVAKRGAAGVMGVAVHGGYGLAVKVWDGSAVVAGMTAIAALDQLGALSSTARDRLQSLARPDVRGGGRKVGSFEPRLELRWE
jgi:L-asparaginase II